MLYKCKITLFYNEFKNIYFRVTDRSEKCKVSSGYCWLVRIHDNNNRQNAVTRLILLVDPLETVNVEDRRVIYECLSN